MKLFERTTSEITEELEKIAKKSIWKKNIAYAAVIIIIILATFVCMFMYCNNLAQKNASKKIEQAQIELDDANRRIDELLNTPIVVNPVSPEIVLDILNTNVAAISELATYQYVFTDSARFTDSKQIQGWSVPWTEKSFVLKWDGVLKAGIDLNDIKIEVQEETKKIQITIPDATILSYEVVSDSVEVLEEKNNLFNPISVEDKIKFDSKTEDAMKSRAIENGLLEKAQDNAELVIMNLLLKNPAVGAEYIIEFAHIDG